MRMRSRSIPFSTGVRNDLLRSTNNSIFYTGEIVPKTFSSLTPKELWDNYGGGLSRCEFRFWHGMQNASQPVSGSSFVGVETIEDMSRKGQKLNKYQFNACKHTSVKGFSFPYLLVMRQANQPYDSFQVYPFYRDTFGTYKVPVIPVHCGDVSAAAARAWWTMQPRFEGTFSAINFLYESKDVVSLFKSGYLLMKKLLNINPTRFERIVKKFYRDNGVDVSKPVSEAVLTYNYGIAPLINDFKEIISSLVASVSTAQEQFKLRGENGTTSHYTEVLYDESQISEPSSIYNWFAKGTSLKTTFNATLNMSYDYDVRSESQALLKFWGLAGSAKAMWDMIPFSFLLDYFIKIGKAIRMMEVDERVHLNDISYGESLLTDSLSGSFIKVSSYYDPDMTILLNGVASSNGCQTNGYSARRYDRYHTSPNKGAALPTLNNTSVKQYANMCALLRSFF